VLWGAPSQGFRRCASTVKADPTPKSPCYKTLGNEQIKQRDWEVARETSETGLGGMSDSNLSRPV